MIEAKKIHRLLVCRQGCDTQRGDTIPDPTHIVKVIETESMVYQFVACPKCLSGQMEIQE